MLGKIHMLLRRGTLERLKQNVDSAPYYLVRTKIRHSMKE